MRRALEWMKGKPSISRLAALRERGFEVVAPTGELASQEMLYIEEQADLASTIKSMVLDLPPHWDEHERQDFSHTADQPT